MNARRRKRLRLLVMLGAGTLWGSPPDTLAAPEPAIAMAREAGVPSGPALKSPVAAFRELLALTPQERKQAVAGHPPEKQKLILAKVREYLSLRPDERELRLCATELRWYLLPLLNTPPTNRAAQLAGVPPEQRKLIQQRLAQWDRLPPETRNELLENELTSRYFTQFAMSTPQQRTNLMAGVSPERRAQLEAGMARWNTLTDGQRRKMCERFDQFFELTPQEKQKALEPFSEAERRQMEKTLRAFEKLPKAQREQCVRSIEEFAGMNLAERQLFLQNVERWRLMSRDERQAWRDLVAKAPECWPPLPPGFMPPLPPGFPPPLPPGAAAPPPQNR